MKVQVYDRITYDLITSAVCEEYKIYKAGDDWCIGIDYFDEGIEQDCSDAMILTKADHDAPEDDLIIIEYNDEDVCITAAAMAKSGENKKFGEAIINYLKGVSHDSNS